MLSVNHNPDVLTCIANLSSDEVFTPPNIVKNILDNLPNEIWKDKNTTFLDPVSKSGAFLREITNRLLEGLENEFPDVEERLIHILKNQVFGLSITELTSLVSRRSLYCSKYADGKYSIVKFDNPDGNIKYLEYQHEFLNGVKCRFCGVSKTLYNRTKELENYAYSFIHELYPEELFNMRFDVIVGNPPYQMSTGGSKAQATPIYNKFVEQAKKLQPRYLTMIIPSRWYSGGMGLKDFRNEMMNDDRVRTIVDFSNSKDCFPGVSISGGVNYFLWDRDNPGKCKFISNHNGVQTTKERMLNEFDVVVRDNIAVDILKKINVDYDKSLAEITSSIDPFDLKTSFRGSKEKTKHSLKVYHSQGIGYIKRKELFKGYNLIDSYKVLLSQTTSEHAGEPSKDGSYKVFAKVEVLKPKEVSTFSYLILGNYDSQKEASNLKKYLTTKFARFVVLQATSSIHLTKDSFRFLPLQDFNHEINDDYLNKKYNLSKKEINYIDKLIRDF